MMERLEMVEKICEKANVTIEEAKEVLERNNWDMLDAMVELERQGKIGENGGNGARATSSADGTVNYEQVNPTASGGESGKEHSAVKKTLQKVWDKIVELFQKSLSNFFVVSKNEETLVRVPVLILVLLVLAAFWLTAVVLIAGLFFNLRYSFQGKELGKEEINSTMGKAADFAQEIVREIKNDADENSQE